MNSSQNIFKKPQTALQNWKMQERNQGMRSLERKREDFHKEIRKQQLQGILRAKRKILFENLANQSNSELEIGKKTLMGCLKAIFNNQNIELNICILVNLLAVQKPFQNYSVTETKPSKNQIDQYCQDLINFMLKKVIPNFTNQPKNRINCLNAISNLLADPLCQNVRFVKIIVESIKKLYGGIQNWGCDQEIIEIYYLIGNLQRKTIIETQFMSIQKLLGFGETGIMKLPSDPLKSLTQGFIKLFSDVDETYNSRHKRSLFTDHFRASREIIIQNMIKRLIATGQGVKVNNNGNLSLDSQSLLSIFRFLNRNRVYFLRVIKEWQEDMEDVKKIKQFSDRLLGIINSPTLKTVTLREIGSFLVNILRYYNSYQQNEESNQKHSQYLKQLTEINEAVKIMHRQFLMPQPITQMVISICHQSFQCKMVFLKIFYQLFYSIQKSLQLKTQQQLSTAVEFILVDKKLENILNDFLSQMHGRIKNADLLKIILQIYHLVIKMTQGKLALRIKQHVHSLLQSPPQFIHSSIFVIMEEIYNLHEEKLQQINI